MPSTPTAHPPATFYRADGYSPEESVGFLMKRVLASMVQMVDRGLADHDLTSAQWGPLLHLHRAGPSTAAELARRLHVDAGAMTRLLDRLERKQLCKRLRSTEDRRVVQVEITPEGVAAIADVPALLAAMLNTHLAGFSHAEWRALQDALRRMFENGEAQRESH